MSKYTNRHSRSPSRSRYDDGCGARSRRSESSSPDEYDRKVKSRYISPDRSQGDLFCKICDSHMNSDQMWESHVQGKRHLKNMKKAPFEQPSKVRVVDADPNEVAFAQKELEEVSGPIVGLGYIAEIRKHDPVLWPAYQCYLCSAHFASQSALEDHLITVKHRLAYLKRKDPDSHNMIEQMKMSKYDMESAVKYKCIQLEAKHGRGVLSVKFEKPKIYPVRSEGKVEKENELLRQQLQLLRKKLSQPRDPDKQQRDPSPSPSAHNPSECFSQKFLTLDFETLVDLIEIRLKSIKMHNESTKRAVIKLHRMGADLLTLFDLGDGGYD